MATISRRSAFGIASVTGMSLLGCSSTESSERPTPSASASPTPTPTPTPTPSPSPVRDTRPRWPLTGALLSDPKDALHPAVAVKIPDNKVEHPQRGINDADIVFVQADGYVNPNGYDGTRLVAVYHSKMDAAAAPVRSVRPVDIPLLAPMNAIIASSGGAPWVMNYAATAKQYLSSDLVYLKMRKTGAYSTDASRIYSYRGKREFDRALVCHPGVLAKKSGVFEKGPLVPYLPFATDTDTVSTTSGKPAKQVNVPWQGTSHIMGYTFDAKSGRYLRSIPWGKHVLADGTRVSTDNILIIHSKFSRRKLVAGGGGIEPINEIISASGTFEYAHGGRYVTGTWKKGALNQVFTFVLDSGEPLFMAPGRTFVEMVRDTTKVTMK